MLAFVLQKLILLKTVAKKTTFEIKFCVGFEPTASRNSSTYSKCIPIASTNIMINDVIPLTAYYQIQFKKMGKSSFMSMFIFEC